MKTVLDSKLGEPLFFVDKTVGSKTVRFPDPRATRGMVALMDMEATIGGAASHFGGPAAFAEMASALFTHFKNHSEQQNRAWTDCFHFVNDAGHCENGIYALRANMGSAGLTVDELKSFRSIESRLTGHGEAHLFPEGVLVSNGPLGSSFGQAQGLALADRLKKNERVTVLLASDGASMEGEAKEVFTSLPGMATKGAINPFLMIISDNNTKLSGRIDQDSFSMAPTFESLSTLGWHVIRLEKGNDLVAAFEAIAIGLEHAKSNPNQPVCIWAKTVKGFGNKKASESASGGHGFSLKSPSELPDFLKEIYDGETLPTVLEAWMDDLIQGKSHSTQIAALNSANPSDLTPPSALQGPTEKVQAGVSRALIRLKQAGLPLLSVTSDLPGSTGVDGFRKAFPESAFDVGVAESNMVSVAAGLSRSGFIPVVDTFAQFGSTKGSLPLIMANLSQAPVVCFYSHTGFQDAADGASHQSLSYWSMTASVPKVDVIHLATSTEAEECVFDELQNFYKRRQSGEVPNSLVFLLGRENFPVQYPGESVPKGSGTAQGFKKQVGSAISKPDLKVALLATAPLLPEAIWAQSELSAQFQIPCEVWHIPCPQRLNREDFRNWVASENITHVICSQDHSNWGGFGNWLGTMIAESKVQLPFRLLSVSSQFGRSAYQASDLYDLYGLGRRAIVKATLEEVRQHV